MICPLQLRKGAEELKQVQRKARKMTQQLPDGRTKKYWALCNGEENTEKKNDCGL